MITIYIRPGCSACHATKVWLRQHGFDFTEHNVDNLAAADLILEELGYTSLPVVVWGDEHWSGFRMNRLLALEAETAASNNAVIE